MFNISRLAALVCPWVWMDKKKKKKKKKKKYRNQFACFVALRLFCLLHLFLFSRLRRLFCFKIKCCARVFFGSVRVVETLLIPFFPRNTQNTHQGNKHPGHPGARCCCLIGGREGKEEHNIVLCHSHTLFPPSTIDF